MSYVFLFVCQNISFLLTGMISQLFIGKFCNGSSWVFDYLVGGIGFTQLKYWGYIHLSLGMQTLKVRVRPLAIKKLNQTLNKTYNFEYQIR